MALFLSSAKVVCGVWLVGIDIKKEGSEAAINFGLDWNLRSDIDDGIVESYRKTVKDVRRTGIMNSTTENVKRYLNIVERERNVQR